MVEVAAAEKNESLKEFKYICSWLELPYSSAQCTSYICKNVFFNFFLLSFFLIFQKKSFLISLSLLCFFLPNLTGVVVVHRLHRALSREPTSASSFLVFAIICYFVPIQPVLLPPRNFNPVLFAKFNSWLVSTRRPTTNGKPLSYREP